MDAIRPCARLVTIPPTAPFDVAARRCSRLAKILVIHGLGMNMRGKVQVERFGPVTLPEYDREIRKYASDLGVDVDIFHSNIEGEVVDRIYGAHDGDVDAALINPAGYSTGHPGLAGAIGQVRFPTIEVHVSNPAASGVASDISAVCRGVISGCGVFGYYLGMKALLQAVGRDQ